MLLKIKDPYKGNKADLEAELRRQLQVGTADREESDVVEVVVSETREKAFLRKAMNKFQIPMSDDDTISFDDVFEELPPFYRR